MFFIFAYLLSVKQLESQIPPQPNSSSQSSGSPLTRRRRQDVKDSASASGDALKPTVITPTSTHPPERPANIPLTSSLNASNLVGFCLDGIPKPQVPPRSSLMAGKNSKQDCDTKSASVISEKMVTAAMNNAPTSAAARESFQGILTEIGVPTGVPTAPIVETKDSSCPQQKQQQQETSTMPEKQAKEKEREFKNIRRRILRGDRRGRSEPVYDAVKAALVMHNESEKEIEQIKSNDVQLIPSIRHQTKHIILRGNFRESRESRLERLRQEVKGNMRRASSLKHVRRRERDNSDWIRDVGKPLSQSQKPPISSIPDYARLPPPSPIMSARSSGDAVNSPPVSRSARLRGELSSLANKVLSRKGRSLSNTDISEATVSPGPTWKDRHSWQAEMATPKARSQASVPLTGSALKSKLNRGKDKILDSFSSLKPSSGQTEKRSRSPGNKASKGETVENKQQDGASPVGPSKDKDSSPRVKRESPGKPLSLS